MSGPSSIPRALAQFRVAIVSLPLHALMHYAPARRLRTITTPPANNINPAIAPSEPRTELSGPVVVPRVLPQSRDEIVSLPLHALIRHSACLADSPRARTRSHRQGGAMKA